MSYAPLTQRLLAVHVSGLGRFVSTRCLHSLKHNSRSRINRGGTLYALGRSSPSKAFSLPRAWPDVRRPSECPRYSNQSRYLAGIVSGIAAHSNVVAMAEAAARIRKPSQWPSPWKINPVAVVLIEAAMAIKVPTDPRTKLNRPVPVVRSVSTSAFPHCSVLLSFNPSLRRYKRHSRLSSSQCARKCGLKSNFCSTRTEPACLRVASESGPWTWAL